MSEPNLIIAQAIRARSSALGNPVDPGTAESFADAALDALMEWLRSPDTVPAG